MDSFGLIGLVWTNSCFEWTHVDSLNGLIQKVQIKTLPIYKSVLNSLDKICIRNLFFRQIITHDTDEIFGDVIFKDFEPGNSIPANFSKMCNLFENN